MKAPAYSVLTTTHFDRLLKNSPAGIRSWWSGLKRRLKSSRWTRITRARNIRSRSFMVFRLAKANTGCVPEDSVFATTLRTARSCCSIAGCDGRIHTDGTFKPQNRDLGHTATALLITNKPLRHPDILHPRSPRAIPGAQKRGTWGTHLQWLYLLLPAPGPRAYDFAKAAVFARQTPEEMPLGEWKQKTRLRRAATSKTRRPVPSRAQVPGSGTALVVTPAVVMEKSSSA